MAAKKVKQIKGKGIAKKEKREKSKKIIENIDKSTYDMNLN